MKRIDFDKVHAKGEERAFSEAQVQAVREALPQYLANVHGITDLRRNFRCLNPEHEDSDPSMKYVPNLFRVRCYGCGKEWDIFDLAGWDEGAETFPDRLRAAAACAGVNVGEPSSSYRPKPKAPKRKERPKPRPVEGENVIDAVFKAAFDLYESKARRALEWLHKRAFSDEELTAQNGIGWCRKPGDVMPGRFDKIHPSKAGFVCIPFPEDPEWSEVRYCVFRPIDCPGLSKELKPEGLACPLYREHLLRGRGVVGGKVYVTEGALDAIALGALLGTTDVCALNGSGGVNRMLNVLADTPRADRPAIVLAFDADEAGRKFASSAKAGLAELGVPCGEVPPFPEGAKDANDYLMIVRGEV